MSNFILYSLFSVLLLSNVDNCFGKSRCAESEYPVCATNGTHWYFFKNLCRLRSENTNREKNNLPNLDITEISNCFKLCNQVCNDEIAPICGVNDEDEQETFDNRCQFDLENCRFGKIWSILHEGKCHIESKPNPQPEEPQVEPPQPNDQTLQKPDDQQPPVKPLPQPPTPQPQPIPQPIPVPNTHPHTHQAPPQILPIPQPNVQPNPQPLPQPQPQVQPLPIPQPNEQPNVQLNPQPHILPLPIPQPNSYPVIQPHPHPQIQPIPQSQPQVQPLPVPQPNVHPLPQPNIYQHPLPHFEPHPNFQIFPQPQVQPLPVPQPNVHQYPGPHFEPHPKPNFQIYPLPREVTNPQPQEQPLPVPEPSPSPYVQQHPQPGPNYQTYPLPHIPQIFPHPINRRCPTHCTLDYDPVCATFDGHDQTFENECYMRADICGSQRAWTVKYTGECHERCNENCPRIYSPMCATFNGQNKTFNNECLFDLEVCVSGNPWNILHYGQCQTPGQNCPKICPSIYSPVCASSNGIQKGFPNKCFVEIDACKTGQDWQIVHEGECDQVIPPHHPLPPYDPTKNCPDVCPALYSPICAVFRGSKRTFSNGCELSVQNCKTGQNWQALFNGQCESENHVPIIPSCSSHYEPICATLNGLRKTFTNKCQMDLEIAITNHAWTILAPGECESLSPYPLPPYPQPEYPHPPPVLPPIVLPPIPQPPVEQPTPTNNNSVIACPICADTYDPVCGFSDGQQQTFHSECLLLSENCASNKKWTVGYKGECQAQENPRNCPNLCPLNYDPVCATFNGVRRTFPNECELNHEAYRTSTQWVILNIGECDYCPVCSDDIAPVCAELDGQTRTFDNVCKVEAEKCRTNKAWKIVSKTSCGINNCPKFCPKFYIPVCGISNGKTRTFSNVCEMKREACVTNTVWNIASRGKCPLPNENCPKSCTLKYSPVCAVYQGVSKQFINECFLRSEICKTHKNWQLLHPGSCATHPQPHPQPHPEPPCDNTNQKPRPRPFPLTPRIGIPHQAVLY
ncbi:uncharacterized protein LOC129916469 [Episyrphus balteatus]|uniref:uncharacterized protein LOC129916469 n=1 Tax=Episyrphus balteatus TaxID=286459 RepID=UPI002485F953|nr:uncharacterized protein LOC129916469 [Episyrphus balteatus]